MAAKVAGTAFFTVAGIQYQLRGNMTIGLGGVHRESVVGMDQYHGYKEVPEAAFIECELTDQPTLDLNVLEALTGVTVTVELINGKTATLANAVQINHLSLNADDGKMTVRFESGQGEWLTAQAQA
jgi:Phage tail tube protein